MKINRALLERFIENYPDQERQTGKSLGLALTYIGEAMRNPNNFIIIKDIDANTNISMFSDSILFETTQQVIKELNLQYFEFKKTNNKYEIIYNIFTELEM